MNLAFSLIAIATIAIATIAIATGLSDAEDFKREFLRQIYKCPIFGDI